ncbi:hypothetical protein ILYODFUR_010923 [Ilyodon furcidens]|uniref:Uncharacterized protein n=1 Tax=Ilyodon furcidens TaxID=33524 RepID=A0ABV0SY45_9TELE
MGQLEGQLKGNIEEQPEGHTWDNQRGKQRGNQTNGIRNKRLKKKQTGDWTCTQKHKTEPKQAKTQTDTQQAPETQLTEISQTTVHRTRRSLGTQPGKPNHRPERQADTKTPKQAR